MARSFKKKNSVKETVTFAYIMPFHLEYVCACTKQIHCQEPFRIILLNTVKYIAIPHEMLKIIVLYCILWMRK